MTKGTLLVVDDNKGLLKALELIMQNEFEKVITTYRSKSYSYVLKVMILIL